MDKQKDTMADRNRLGRECAISTGAMIPRKALTPEVMREAKAETVAKLQAERAPKEKVAVPTVEVTKE